MSMTINALPDIIFTILALGYTIYLAHVQLDKNKRKALLGKHKKGTPNYELNQRIYSTQFLIAWILLTAWLMFNLLFQRYRYTHSHISLLAVLSALFVSVLVSSCGFYLWARLFNRQKSK